ncbi:trace amine-associated receptor 1-like [Girardinichthys multiradiatus]|uniref:trace amine-associated receptor 1-like n=1 Tax=Girardinichthys multiradiatus TaxID=208333 RepID=UPI001FAD62DC|nr:trace amine-associated receptor 1-like [Girardinichthys multiradiatus]
MDAEFTVNSSNGVNHIHPCYVSDNGSNMFANNPSIICISLYLFLGLLSVVTVCGNFLVIFSIIYFRQLHTPTNYLILSLAVADLLVGVLVFPFSMAFTVTLCMQYESLFCKIRDCFDVTMCTSSILNLCCISIDRYYAVCEPLTYRTTINAQVTAVMILFSWGVSVLIGIGIIVAGFSQGICEDICSVDIVVANTIGPVFSFYLPAVIMLCIYFKIFLVAQKQLNSIQNKNCLSMKSGATVSRMERKATKTLAIVMGVFLLCLTPYFSCVVFQPLYYNPPPFPVIETLNWLTLSNSMLNPIIYAFFYRWFRSAFRMVISGKIFQRDLVNSRLF